jgi:HEAT repeat protein
VEVGPRWGLRAGLAGVLIALMLAVGPGDGVAAGLEEAAALRLLSEHGLSTEPIALLDFFRMRTLQERDQAAVARLIQQLGAESFVEREAAARELVLRGTAVRAALLQARNDPDREIARRVVRCVEEIDAGPGAELPIAAARALGQRPVSGAGAVLLAYLPHAGDETIEDAVRAALLAQYSAVGTLDAAVLEALRDSRPRIRAAAAAVVGRRGDPAQRDLARQLLTDRDLLVRFRAAQALLAGGDRSAARTLIDLLTEAPHQLLWQVEEALYHLAGDQAPAVPSLEGAEARRQAHAVWSEWWSRHAETIDPARIDERDRLVGLTLGVEYNTGRVWEAGPDGSIRWELTGLSGPMDAQMLPGGRLLVAEANARRVTERDRAGHIVWEKKLDGEPTGCQRLPNGNTFVSTYTGVMEFRRDGTTAFAFTLGSGSNAIRKHRNGHVVYAIQGEIVEMDVAGNRIRSVPIPRESMWVGLVDLPGDRYLLANSSSGQVIEVDRTGKIVWEARVPGACGVDRLPNGNTLVATSQRVVELDRAAKTVWEKRSGGYVRRVHRR